MQALRVAINIAWLVFWLYWLAAAANVKQSASGKRPLPLTGLTLVAALVLLRVLSAGGQAVDSAVLGAIGAVVFASGLGLAVWARVHLGRNWGMPRTQKAEPELVTSGPYRFVRHPVYSGLLLGLLGTTLASNLLGLIVVVVVGAYFYYSARVEERNLTASFPIAYPEYQAGTKMLIPFVL